ncbi:hypothetical protein MMC07_002888 [Pseudocyphellaria aurata]|nr:hypothetical protein [Pseudocyphellaria aurata]
MGNFASRETSQLLDHKSFQHIATNLGNFLQHHGEHEKIRAAESSERQQRRKAKEALKSPPQEQQYHFYHHFDPRDFEPLLPLYASRRDGDHYPRGYSEEPPFEEERHARRRDPFPHGHNTRSAFHPSPRPECMENLTSSVLTADYDDRALSRPQDPRVRVHQSHGHRRHGHRSHSRHPEPTAMDYPAAYPPGARAPSSLGSSGYSPRAPHARTHHQPGSGSERGGRPPRGRRSQPMQPPRRGPRPPMGMGMGPPPPPRGMGPHPENHAFHIRGGPGPGPPAAGGDNGTFDEEDEEDADDGIDGPPAMGGTPMGADAGMPGFRDGFDPERRLGRGMRREGLGTETAGPE